jgi:hypothetical protein
MEVIKPENAIKSDAPTESKDWRAECVQPVKDTRVQTAVRSTEFGKSVSSIQANYYLHS